MLNLIIGTKCTGFLSHFGYFGEKWRFCLKKWSKISFGTTFGIVTNKLDQKHNRWRKVKRKNFRSWATSLCPNDHFWPYILYIFYIYAIFIIFGLNKPKMTKIFLFSKTSTFPLQPPFRSSRGDKNSLRYPHLKFDWQKTTLFYNFVRQLSPLHDIY